MNDYYKLLTLSCNYCGQKIDEKKNNFNGIDRINSDEDYTKENCVSCCKRCNYMKNKMSKTEFAESILKLFPWAYEELFKEKL